MREGLRRSVSRNSKRLWNISPPCGNSPRVLFFLSWGRLLSIDSGACGAAVGLIARSKANK